MSTEPLDHQAQIMAEHERSRIPAGWDWCLLCDTPWPCLPYRLAEALAAEQMAREQAEQDRDREADRYVRVRAERDTERARVQRVEALALRWERGVGTSGRSSEQLRAALAGDTEGES